MLGLNTLTNWLAQGQGPYAAQLKKTEADMKEVQKRINEKLGLLSRIVTLAASQLATCSQGSRSRTLA
jgi:hypothetical protein